MVYRKRLGIWIIFVIICLVVQIIAPLVPSAIVNIREWQLNQELKDTIEEREEAERVAAETEATIGENEEKDSERESAASALRILIETICSISRYIGILIVIYGVFSLTFAFMREDAEGISRGITMMVVGGSLIGLSMVFSSMYNGMTNNG